MCTQEVRWSWLNDGWPLYGDDAAAVDAAAAFAAAVPAAAAAAAATSAAPAAAASAGTAAPAAAAAAAATSAAPAAAVAAAVQPFPPPPPAVYPSGRAPTQLPFILQKNEVKQEPQQQHVVGTLSYPVCADDIGGLDRIPAQCIRLSCLFNNTCCFCFYAFDDLHCFDCSVIHIV